MQPLTKGMVATVLCCERKVQEVGAEFEQTNGTSTKLYAISGRHDTCVSMHLRKSWEVCVRVVGIVIDSTVFSLSPQT